MLSKEAAQSSGLRVEFLLALISAPADNNKSTTGYQIPQIGIPGRTPDCLSTRTPPAESRDEGYGGQRKCFGSSSRSPVKGCVLRYRWRRHSPPVATTRKRNRFYRILRRGGAAFRPTFVASIFSPASKKSPTVAALPPAATRAMQQCVSTVEFQIVGIAPRSKRSCTVEGFPHLVALESIVSPSAELAKISAPASTRSLTHVSSDSYQSPRARACVRNGLRETC
jgi:hypothetical protein